ncbi:PEGA domain-containing protein [Candidatus Gottesmanbacteria bacterium]|nr:PEGA domain-containing protein [Candidatus Gottesmanbacteria bacterium]
MKKIIIIAVALLIIAGGGVALLATRSRGKTDMQAVLKVTSTPQSTIFLDNTNIGKTPYESKVAPGEYSIKLIPESGSETFISWEGKIILRENLLTYINRDLGRSELTTGGEILTLEKVSGNKAELAVLSTPDGVTVSVSGEEKGKTPLLIEDISPGSYDLTVAGPGFTPRTVKIKTTAGYKLHADFQLASTREITEPSPSAEPQVSPSGSPKSSPKTTPKATPKQSPVASASATLKPQGTPPPKPYIEILDTPTGFLRVRNTPSGEEVGRVNPGEFYALLDEDNGWYKIEYETDKEGWVSGEYAKKVE